MSQVPARYIGTHHYNWKPSNNEHAGRRERNIAVLRQLEREKTEKHIQNLIAAGHRPPLTSAQQKAGARRII
jgi:hypothetical protein